MPQMAELGASQGSWPDALRTTLSSRALPSRDRLAIFCDHFARQVLRVHAEPVADAPFWGEVTITKLPGLTLVSSRSSALTVGRTRSMLRPGDDGLVFQLARSQILANHLGREEALAPGCAMAMTNAEPGSLTVADGGDYQSLVVSMSALRPMLENAEDCCGRPLAACSPALRLLRDYLESLNGVLPNAPVELQKTAVGHILDLIAVALGATRDATELARNRGIAAAHLLTIRKYIAQNLGHALSLDSVAAHHGITPRYVQKLFQCEGTSFSEFVRERRLETAYRMLLNIRFNALGIAEIAYEAGFGDLSHFNRSFRERFGMPPSHVRQTGSARCN